MIPGYLAIFPYVQRVNRRNGPLSASEMVIQSGFESRWGRHNYLDFVEVFFGKTGRGADVERFSLLLALLSLPLLEFRCL